VYKIAGALARQGASLDEVYDTANLVASQIVTIGVGLEHCHVRMHPSLTLLLST
jgi:dihydroxyacetone kinase